MTWYVLPMLAANASTGTCTLHIHDHTPADPSANPHPPPFPHTRPLSHDLSQVNNTRFAMLNVEPPPLPDGVILVDPYIPPPEPPKVETLKVAGATPRVGGATPREGVGRATPREGNTFRQPVEKRPMEMEKRVGGATPREKRVGGATPREKRVGGATPREGVGRATPREGVGRATPREGVARATPRYASPLGGMSARKGRYEASPQPDGSRSLGLLSLSPLNIGPGKVR